MPENRPPAVGEYTCLPANPFTGVRSSEGCFSYAPGHAMHHIQAKLVGRTPWGWRQALVAAVTDDRGGARVEAVYLEQAEAAPLRLWLHTRPVELGPGYPVRVHEQYHVLDTGAGWRNARMLVGCGPVPVPDEPQLWSAETSAPITEVATGLAYPPDHPGLADLPDD